MKLIKDISTRYEIDKNKVYHRHHTAHLIQTGYLLKKSGCDMNVINAGIFHSIYDSDSIYGNAGVPIKDRENIVSMTNKQTEELIYKYSIAHASDDYEDMLISEYADNPYLAQALADILICDMIEQIIWCVEKKNFFSFTDALEHLTKLLPVVSHANNNVRNIFNIYISRCEL